MSKHRFGPIATLASAALLLTSCGAEGSPPPDLDAELSLATCDLQKSNQLGQMLWYCYSGVACATISM